MPFLVIQILIFQCPPVYNHQPVRIVPRPRHVLDIAGCHHRPFQITGTAFNELCTIVGKFPLVFVKLDGITHDGTNCGRRNDVGVEADFQVVPA